MPALAHVTDASFDADVLRADRPVLVDFWAEWSGASKMNESILQEIATEYDDKLTIVRLDVGSNQATPAKHGIRDTPTLILFKNGAPVAQKVGTLSKSQLTAFLDQNV
jgi:thioredoxin